MSVIYGRTDSESRLLKKYPKEVRKIEDIPKAYQKLQEKEFTGFFAFLKKWNQKRRLKNLEETTYRLYKGAQGEKSVLKELEKLGNDFHVLCGLKIRLPRPLNFNGQRNLRSAQMDFVVVCKKGVYMIEVKNWSDQYFEKHNGLSPYEQTERAGKVLWFTLNNFFADIRVRNVLLSINGNIPFGENSKVYVSSLDRINWFLQTREDTLSEIEIKKIVNQLKRYVTR